MQYWFQFTRNNVSTSFSSVRSFLFYVPLFGRQRINALQQNVRKTQRECSIQVPLTGFIDCRSVAKFEGTSGRKRTLAFGGVYYFIWFAFGRISYIFDLHLTVFRIYFSFLPSRDQEERLTSSYIDGWRLYSPPLQCQREDGREFSDLRVLPIKLVALCVRIASRETNGSQAANLRSFTV